MIRAKAHSAPGLWAVMDCPPRPATVSKTRRHRPPNCDSRVGRHPARCTTPPTPLFPAHRCTTQCCWGHIRGSKARICPALTWHGQAEFPRGCAHAASARPECTRHSAGSSPLPRRCAILALARSHRTASTPMSVQHRPAIRESLRAIRQARRRRRQSQHRPGQTQTPPPAKLRTASVLLAHPREGKRLSLGLRERSGQPRCWRPNLSLRLNP